MNKAFSLAEVMVGLVIGLISIAALLGITRDQVSRHLENRIILRAQSSLNLAGEELDSIRAMRDPVFWDEFQLNPVVPHNPQAEGGAIAYHAECPTEFSSGCFTYYDIEPAEQLHKEIVIYKATSHHLPHSITLVSKDPTHPPGLGPEIEEMSVLFLCHSSWSICLLVNSTESDEVSFLALDQLPWLNPNIDFQELSTTDLEVVCLGRLVVTHIGLKPVEGSGQRLTYRPFILKEGQWIKKRSRSSYQNLHLMELTSSPDMGSQLILFDERAKPSREGASHVTIQ